MNRQLPLSFIYPGEMIVDLFAGGGGASLAIEQAFGRPVDLAVNHDPIAVAMHRANHPGTRHECEDVFDVDPRAAVGDRRVALLHASPDCTHHSQARGGQPRSRIIRALSWVVLKWAGRVRPRVITLENVEQILQWSPLVAKRSPDTGRVLRLDGRTVEPGERTPIDQQFLVPCTRRRGHNWRHFVGALRAMGYDVQWRKLRACDFGAGTSRERLFMVARCDGQTIRWPAPTHGKAPGLKPFVTAADCLDRSIPCPSIFTRRKPLADATLRRIARGIKRFVLDAPEPFIVPNNTKYLEQANTGMTGHDARKPTSTMVGKGCTQRLVTAHLAKFRFDSAGAPMRAPLPTITSGGAGVTTRPAGAAHAMGVVTGNLAALSDDAVAGALRVAAFLINYYGNGTPLPLDDPAATITTRDRLALVTVTIKGTPYVIVDIGLRMLDREELKRAQGFPADYRVDLGVDEHGRQFPLTKAQSTHKIGNSVSPPPYRALVAANVGDDYATHKEEGRAAA